MPTLRIKRTSPWEAGQFRRIKVDADGSTVAKLRPEEEVSLTLPVGTHNISARMDWFTGGPVAVRLTEDQTVTVIVSLSMKEGWRGFINRKRGIKVELA